METKQFNILLIVGSIVLILLTALMGQVLSPNPLPPLNLLWIFAGLFGAFNFTKWPMWVKIVVSVVATPLVAYILFMLVWGITSGFTFTK
jgi:hypothetical protein